MQTFGTDGPLTSDGLRVNAEGTITLWSGRRVDPLNMTPDDIDITDIAHALSRTCRYNGHCAGFLSVARHSLWVSEELHPFDDEMKLWGLLHDAAEAYIGDMVRPMKHMPAMEPFRVAEEQAERAIAEHYRLPWPIPVEVREADNYVLIERELPDLRGSYFGNVEDDERDFLARFEQLVLA